MFTIDDSLSIVNRTGAYYIARDLVATLAPPARLRRWRLGGWLPEGLPRKLAARAMMAEYRVLGASAWMRMGGGPTLFLDPLYVLRSSLGPEDLVLCHDPGPITCPHLYSPAFRALYERAYARIVQARPGLVFVSDWSRQAFVSAFGDDFPLMRVIPLYLRQGIFDHPAQPCGTVSGRFFLTVGALEHRKNQQAALAAYAMGGFHARGISYVLCGSRGDAGAEIEAMARAIPGVILPGYVSAGELRWLYEQAEAFVLPSLLEGFGMPALEAAAAGLLPLVSRGSALVEAVDGLCVELDPHNPADIARALHAALGRSVAEREAMADRLRAMAARFTRHRFVDGWREVVAAWFGADAGAVAGAGVSCGVAEA